MAKENGFIKDNPCNRAVKANMGREPTTREAMTVDEQQKFLMGISGDCYEKHFQIVLLTGLRVGELSGLKWEDIDIPHRMFKVRRAVYHCYGDEPMKWQGFVFLDEQTNLFALTAITITFVEFAKETESDISRYTF